jgi:hypothetical protein
MDELEFALKRIGMFVQEKAMEMCPIDMGELHSSIHFRIEGDSVIIFSDSEHAEDMEYGKPPEPLSDEEWLDVEGWANRHNYDPAGVALGIEKRGIKVGTVEKPMKIGPDAMHNRGVSYRPFLRPAIYMNWPEIVKIAEDGLKRQL